MSSEFVSEVDRKFFGTSNPLSDEFSDLKGKFFFSSVFFFFFLLMAPMADHPQDSLRNYHIDLIIRNDVVSQLAFYLWNVGYSVSGEYI